MNTSQVLREHIVKRAQRVPMAFELRTFVDTWVKRERQSILVIEYLKKQLTVETFFDKQGDYVVYMGDDRCFLANYMNDFDEIMNGVDEDDITYVYEIYHGDNGEVHIPIIGEPEYD